MKICITASACLVIGLLAPMVYAVEKPQRGERRATDGKKGGAASREPADIASKMLSEFDTDGDGMLNLRELTTMFDGMGARMQQVRNGQSRPGQSRPGQGRAGQSKSKADQRVPRAGSSRNQPLNGRPNGPKSAGASPSKLNNLQGRPTTKSPKQRARGQSGDPAAGQRPGGVRPEPNAAQ